LAQGIETPGRRKLIAWQSKDPKVRTQGYIAEKIGRTQPGVRNWLKGINRPDLESQDLLEALTDGEVSRPDWETAKERVARLRHLERVKEAAKSA
jgi:predicted transcriptional regulator